MRLRTWLITFVSALPDGRDVCAQQPAQRALSFVHERWTIEDGLPVNAINAVRQSRDGYIWAATFDGLVRFDGARFTVFNMRNTPGLTSNRLISLSETRDGSLWVLTEQRQFVRFHDGRFTPIGPESGAVHLYEDAGDTIWIGTTAGLSRVDGGRLTGVAEGRIPGPVTWITRRQDGVLWVATDGKGLYRLSGDRVERVPTGTALDSTAIWITFEDPERRLWIGGASGAWLHHDGVTRQLKVGDSSLVHTRALTWHPHQRAVYAFSTRGLHRLEGTGAVATAVGPLYPYIDPAVGLDSEGFLWSGTLADLYRDGRHVYTLPPGPRGPPTVTTLTLDREGSIWLGTAASGLHRLKPALLSVVSVPEGLHEPNTYSVYADRAGNVWAGGAESGLSRISRDGKVSTFPSPTRRFGRTSSFDDDGSGRLTVATDWGIYVCALPALECALEESPVVGRRVVWALFRDSRGRLWAGLDERAVVQEAGRWTSPAPWPTGARVRAFAETRDGAIWMGTNGTGLVRFHGGRASTVTAADGLPNELVRALYVDADGWLWVGTEGGGLARLDPAAGSAAGGRKTIVSIGTKDGLYDEGIHQILEDDFGRLWMSTNRGIFWVPRAELVALADGKVARVHSTNYTERDGMRNREGNGGVQPAGAKGPDGRLWFATQDGVVVVDPARVEGNRVVPPVAIERVIAGDTAIVPRGTPISLGVDRRDLEIQFTALSFLAPGNVRFRYRLDPYDAAWVDAGNRRTAFYTQVPHGRYTFRVIASNDAGVWNETGARLELSLAPHLWETSAFRAAILLSALLAAAWAAFRWRSRVQRRARELERQVAERTAALRDRERQLAAQNAELAGLHEARSRLFANLSHEFRTPLTLILGPLRGLLDGRYGALDGAGREQTGLMLRNGQRLLRLINQVLDLSRLQAGALTLDRRAHDLVGFARGMTLAFAPLAERRGIALRFSATAYQLLVSFDAEQAEKVLLNLLSNALKFTERGGEVQVSVRAVAGGAEVAVRDTGVGIAAHELPRVFDRFYQADSSATRRYEGTGIGLALARELVELHGGEIRAESTVGRGSTFTVLFPLGTDVEGGVVAAMSGAVPEEDARGNGSVHRAPDDAVSVAAGEVDGAGLGLATPDVGTPIPEETPHDAGPAGEADVEDHRLSDRTTVLVVDDNPDVRAYVCSVLAAAYRVIEAGDGSAGLERARSALPDCIVADVMMPKMDGLAMGRALKDSTMTDAIPIILLTARAAAEDQIAGLETGADAYLVKPFDPGVLEATVANLLAQRRRLRERFRSGEEHPPSPPPASTPSALDVKLRAIVHAQLTDPDFGPEALAGGAGLSYQRLYRALRDELGATPSRFIRTVRVECAAELLRRGAGSVTEIGYAVGFESLSYFRRAYRERFGVSPAEHAAARTVSKQG